MDGVGAREQRLEGSLIRHAERVEGFHGLPGRGSLRVGDRVHVLAGCARVIDHRQGLQVTLVRGERDLAVTEQVGDAFAHGHPLRDVSFPVCVR